MNKITCTTYEEIQEDRNSFNIRHPDSLWKPYIHNHDEKESIYKKLNFLINTQNGSDIDDYCINESSPVKKYLENDVKEKDVLVLGTGTGREVKLTKELGARTVESTTLGQRNALYAKEVVGVNTTICDIHAMPWKNNSFDVIAGFQVFEHSYMPIGFLLECNRLLKTGGLLCLETPDSENTSLDSWLHHLICPTPRQTYNMLIKTGFFPVQFNDNDLTNITYKTVGAVKDIDSPSVWVMTKSIKLDPMTYERGDMARYYSLINTK